MVWDTVYHAIEQITEHPVAFIVDTDIYLTPSGCVVKLFYKYPDEPDWEWWYCKFDYNKEE